MQHSWNTTSSHFFFLALCTAIATFPLFLPDYLPGVDIPQHAGQINLLLHMYNPDFPFRQLFTVHWLTPYLFGYSLVLCIMPVVGLAMAFKIVAGLALWSIPMATAYMLRNLKQDIRLALLCIPCLYGFPFQWGFFNFYVAVPIALFFLGYIYSLQERLTPRQGVVIVLGVNILFFCHALIWALCGVLAYAAYWTLHASWRQRLVFASLLLSSLPLCLYWFSTDVIQQHMVDHGAFFALSWQRLNILDLVIGDTQKFYNLAIGFFVLLAPLLLNYRLSAAPARWLPLLCIILILLFVPHSFLRIAFLYQRFSIFFIPFYLVALEKRNISPSSPQRLTTPLVLASSGAIFLLFLINTTNAMLGFNAEIRGFNRILQVMEPERRVLMLEYANRSQFSTAPLFLHFPLWYQALRGGVVDFNAASAYTPIVQFQQLDNPADIPGFEWNPWLFNYVTFQGTMYSYFIVRSPVDLSRVIFGSHLYKVQLVRHIHAWWLYRNLADPSDKNISHLM